MKEEIASYINAESFSAEVAPMLTRELVGKKPDEIEKFCDTYVKERLAVFWSERADRCAFKFGVSREKVLSVLKEALRDELFQLL